jgi:CRISPR-associated protein Cmx8
VPFSDRARFQFLLHFWPFAASVYVPAVEDRDGKREFSGYAVAVPDVADLKSYCDELPRGMRERSADKLAYVPRDSVVALPAEAGLCMLDLLRRRLTNLEGGKSIADLVVGVDVIHAEKRGNTIKLAGLARIEPDPVMAGEYARLHGLLWDLTYRRVRVGNLLTGRPWLTGFDRALSTQPVDRLLGRSPFAHDAREDFEKRFSTYEGTMTNEERANASLEGILLQVVQAYLSRKLSAKHGLKWSEVKDKPEMKQVYGDEKEKLAKGAFYAVRSRTGRDFVDYFASTLCSVPQHLDDQRFTVLAAALRERPDEVRTLTMLALSARS